MKNSIFIFSASAITLCSVLSVEAQTKSDTTDKETNVKVDSSVTNKAISHQDTLEEEKSKVLGGAEMLPSKNIIDNTSKSKDHTTLVSVIKSAGLTDSLKSKGPFTVFAPTNEAFSKLPAGTLETLEKPVNKEKLVEVIEFHVVPGKLTARDLALAVARGNGNATLTTVEGENLNVSINTEKNLQITDGKGNIALVTMFDVVQSNGVVHVINNVLLPKE